MKKILFSASTPGVGTVKSNEAINDLEIDTDDSTREFNIENVFIPEKTYHLKISVKDLGGNISTFERYYEF